MHSVRVMKSWIKLFVLHSIFVHLESPQISEFRLADILKRPNPIQLEFEGLSAFVSDDETKMLNFAALERVTI